MRTAARAVHPRIAKPFSFPAATSGWISNQNLAAPSSQGQGAVMLENIMPTATGGEVRRGSQIYATLGTDDLPVTSLFSYNNGNNRKFFGANATTIYDITTISSPINYRLSTGTDEIITDTGEYLGQGSTDGLNVVNNQHGGDWVVTQFAATGNTYLVAVNAVDDLELFDGTSWYPIDGTNILQLNFDAQTAAFSKGHIVTGSTSGAIGTVVGLSGTSPIGTLLLSNVTGTFVDNELLTEAGGGSATANGTTSLFLVGITGIDTDKLAYVWNFKGRLFFIERDSMNVWYLPIDAVGGAMVQFPMGGLFPLGGSLLFGAPWSLDTSGDGGLSEQCVFVTTEGEVAVYQGTDPSTATTWSKVGTYRVGKPLGHKAFIRAGGDLIICTDIGAVPLSQAVNRDFAALSPSAVSYPIETAWNDAVEFRSATPWNAIVWPERQMFVISLPTVNQQPPLMYIANARTGAWADFTNWDGTCLEVFEGRMFYGSIGGKVVEAYVTGLDQGATYTATYVPLFVDLGNAEALKIPENARLVTRGAYDCNPQISMQFDYILDLPPPPAAAILADSSVWGVGIWGQSVWGATAAKKIQQQWASVGGLGYSIAPAIQITSGSIIPLDTEIIRIDGTYDITDILA